MKHTSIVCALTAPLLAQHGNEIFAKAWQQSSSSSPWTTRQPSSILSQAPNASLGSKLRLSKMPDMGTVEEANIKDYSSEAAGLFGNIRVPAALFAGASAGAAFALPLVHGDGLQVGMIKRVYALLMMGALSSQIVAVVISTLALSAISTHKSQRLSTSLRSFMLEFFDFEWISCRLHFFAGVMFFSLAVGLRAWIAISCSVVAKAALGLILSALFLCLSFWRHLEGGSLTDGALRLPIRYYAALLRESKKSVMFAISLLLSITTCIYIVANINHVYQYLK